MDHPSTGSRVWPLGLVLEHESRFLFLGIETGNKVTHTTLVLVEGTGWKFASDIPHKSEAGWRTQGDGVFLRTKSEAISVCVKLVSSAKTLRWCFSKLNSLPKSQSGPSEDCALPSNINI